MIQVIKPSLIIVAAAALVACAPTEDEVIEEGSDTDKEVVNVHVEYGVTYEEVERVPEDEI